jgi:hypothetical protein
MDSDHWFADIGSAPFPSNVVMSRLYLSWRFAIDLGMFSWLEKCLLVVPESRKKTITSEFLRTAATADVYSANGARGYTKQKPPNRQCILFLLQNDGDPNYKRQYAKDSTWDSVLIRGQNLTDKIKTAQDDTENYDIVVKDFFRYEAADWTQSVLASQDKPWRHNSNQSCDRRDRAKTKEMREGTLTTSEERQETSSDIVAVWSEIAILSEYVSRYGSCKSQC